MQAVCTRRGIAAVAVSGALLAAAVGCGSSAVSGTRTPSGPQSSGSSVPDTTPLQNVKLTAAQVSALGHDDDLFAGDLMQAITKNNTGNVVISPASIAIALQMLTDGARGETQTQLLQALHANDLSTRTLTAASAELLKNLSDLGKQLSISDDVWVQTGQHVTPQFAADMKTGFDGALHSIDFTNSAAAAQTINNAISTDTHGHITNLLSPDALEGAVTVLTNAIYMHADWEMPFETGQTSPATFTLGSGQTSQVQTMHQMAEWQYSDQNGTQVVTLPYQGDQLAMSIVLPAQGSSPAAVESAAAGSGWDSILDGGNTTLVNLSLPRFQLRTTTDLDPTLQSLGITDAFGSGADLAGICQQCSVSDVQHQAWMKTDEKGTTAAAATAISITTGITRADPPTGVTMNVNRPYLAIIRDTKTGLPLFIAQVADPSAG